MPWSDATTSASDRLPAPTHRHVRARLGPGAALRRRPDQRGSGSGTLRAVTRTGVPLAGPGGRREECVAAATQQHVADGGEDQAAVAVVEASGVVRRTGSGLQLDVDVA